MVRGTLKLAALATSMLAPAAAWADGQAVGLKVGALGLGAEYSLLGDPSFQQDIDAEIADIESELDLDVIPFLMLGFQFRF